MTSSTTAKTPLKGLASLVRNDRGTVAVITAVAIVPLILAMGLAVDATRAYMMRAKLSAALDAAGLAIGAGASQSVAQQYVDANLGTSGTTTPTVSTTSTTVTVSATASYTTGFMGLMGITSLPISASSTISFAQKQGVEVALVLDNTGSLSYPGGDNTTLSNSNIMALKTAAGKFVQTVFGTTTVNNPGVRVGIVPYVAVVNPGPTVAPLMVKPVNGQPAAVTTNFTKATAAGWMGCVVERMSTFASIRANQTPLNAYSTVAQDLDTVASDANNNYLTQYVWPHDWPVYGWNWSQGTSGVSTNITLPPYANGNMIQGPNQSCPTPAVPMTSSSAALFTSIGADPTTGQAIANQGMEQWQKGGTMGSIGMAWGYRMLSPNGPFAAAGQPTSGWRATAWQKVIVLMTDGVNETHQDNTYNDYTGDPTTTNGTIKTPSQGTIDLEEEAVCDALRANGVIIYTVFLNSGTAAGNAISYCPGTTTGNAGTNSPYYFDAQNQTQLYQAFGTIAKQLSNLRVSK